jgi:hypothetical protein
MPTRYPGTPAETAALDAYIKLMRAAEAVTVRVGGVMTDAGLTIGQFGVLEALLHHGPLCQHDLGTSCCAAMATPPWSWPTWFAAASWPSSGATTTAGSSPSR